jgi:hypothetical protein
LLLLLLLLLLMMLYAAACFARASLKDTTLPRTRINRPLNEGMGLKK